MGGAPPAPSPLLLLAHDRSEWTASHGTSNQTHEIKLLNCRKNLIVHQTRDPQGHIKAKFLRKSKITGTKGDITSSSAN